MLVLFNLIPAFPMDGGRVLRAAAGDEHGRAARHRIAARIGQGFACSSSCCGLFYNPILMFVGIFIYFAASAEEQPAAFTGFASRLKVKDAMEPSPVLLAADQPLSEAVDALLASPQKEFPVLDGAGRIVGLLDRDAMILALARPGCRRAGGRGDARPASRCAPEQPLPDAFTRMRQRGATAEVVADAAGPRDGHPDAENMAEMMMVESARPGWRFRRR